MTILKFIIAGVLLWIAAHILLWSYLKRRIARAKAEALAAPPVQVEGGCHCGAVRYRFSVKQHVTVLDCNCSMCSKMGFLHLIVPHKGFTLLTPRDALGSYRFGTGAAEHLFCKACGVKSFYQPRSHPESWSVNWHCLDEGHGLIETIQPFDGKNWEEAKALLQ
jgi:hypothetical protein